MKDIVLAYRAFGKESTVGQEFLGGFQNLPIQAVKLIFRYRPWRNLNIEVIYRLKWLKILSAVLGEGGRYCSESSRKGLAQALRKAKVKRLAMRGGVCHSYVSYFPESGTDLRYMGDLLGKKLERNIPPHRLREGEEDAEEDRCCRPNHVRWYR